MATTERGNFDTGIFEFNVNGETVLALKLNELDQYHDDFQPLLQGTLSRAIQRAYRLGKIEGKENAMSAVKAS